jgi:hypothetical protein
MEGPAGWLAVLRGRPAGGGRKPPQAAAVKSRGGERCGKVAPVSAAGMGQEGERKRSTDDVSKGKQDDIETGRNREPGNRPGGSLSIGQAVSGMEVARAWSGLWCGTCEPVVPIGRPASGARSGPRLAVWSENPKWLIREGESSDAGHRGGQPRGSCEAQ